MKTDIVQKFKLYNGYTGKNGTSGCRIYTGSNLTTERGFGAILDILAYDRPRTHREISEILKTSPYSNHDSLAWGRTNGLLTYDSKTYKWNITEKGRKVLREIYMNENSDTDDDFVKEETSSEEEISSKVNATSNAFWQEQAKFWLKQAEYWTEMTKHYL